MKYSTIEEWSNRIEAAEPRDTDTVGEAMRRIAKLHLEMLGELAARLEEIAERHPARVAVGEKRADSIRVQPLGDLGPLPTYEPAKGRARDLRLANALEIIEAMPCMLASDKPKGPEHEPYHAGDGRFACLELRVPSPCATCVAHEALES